MDNSTNGRPSADRLMSHLFCFGTGYVASRLAADLLSEGWTAAGTFRESTKRDTLAKSGIEPVLFDGSAPVPSEQLENVTHILISIPPGEDGDPALVHHAGLLEECESLRWVGYLSATSVYGDSGGALVDEDAPLLATALRGRRRVEAERAWLDLNLPIHVFRLAGIYGPGRSALDQLTAGMARRIDAPGHLFSRIHVDDIVAVLRASMAKPKPGAIYNVCDDEPSESADVVAFAADLLGLDPPPLVVLEDAELSPMARSFYADRRLIDNRRIRNELGVVLQYPDYRAGLAAILAERIDCPA